VGVTHRIALRPLLESGRGLAASLVVGRRRNGRPPTPLAGDPSPRGRVSPAPLVASGIGGDDVAGDPGPRARRRPPEVALRRAALLLRRLPPLVVAGVLLSSALPARAGDDEEAQLEFFYPVITGRPVIERELELKVRSVDGPSGRETAITGSIELPVLPRWQVEVEIPWVVLAPSAGPSAGGVGDIELENKFLIFRSITLPALIAVGFDTTLPTGSAGRGLGGDAAIEPFGRAAVALGPFDLLGEVTYEWNLNAHVHGERAQELTSGLAVGYIATDRLTPLLELNTVTLVRGQDAPSAPLRGRTQLYLTPGANVRVAPGTVARFGVELPVSGARQFDYALHAGLTWEF
jgi:hypothetical protein